jgi:hypothetical protein
VSVELRPTSSGLTYRTTRNNELSRILTRVVEIGLRGGWAEVVDQVPLKIPASVVSHSELADPRAGRGSDDSLGESMDHDVASDSPQKRP